MKSLTLVLAGNPNAGKTTLFNAITGARQKTGNWGGVTVEVKEGETVHQGTRLRVIDLPGAYSLSPRSPEEALAIGSLLAEKSVVLVNVVEASNLERNLYLTAQLLELGRPLCMALNMSDELAKNGVTVDTAALGRLLGVSIIPTIGRTGEGVCELLDAAVRTAGHDAPGHHPIRIPYGSEIEEEISKLETILQKADHALFDAPLRWYALRLLESDAGISGALQKTDNGNAVLSQAKKSRDHLQTIYKDDPATLITERRYGFITGALRETLKINASVPTGVTRNIDAVLLHPIFAYLLFGALMWGLFTLTFKLGALPMAGIQSGIDLLSGLASRTLPEGLFRSLMIEGVLAGAGSVLIFLPNILILFFGISILEDTGYMARAAFLMDKIMHKMGLHGKSFIPMVMGLGCNVPALMAARTLEARSDRILTLLITPLITCSARLPIYVLFAGAFFGKQAGNMVFLIYLLSFGFTFSVGLLLRRLFFKDAEYPFVMELPPYRLPTLKSVLLHMWEKGKHYLIRIGKVIFVFSIILFFLSHYPATDRGIEDTFIGRIGRVMEPVTKPAGFDLKMNIGLITGFFAKEMVVGTLGVLYGAETKGEPRLSLTESLRSHYTRLQAFAFMLFCLLYTPCLASLSTMVRELKSGRWSLFGTLYPIVLAWIVAVAVYQIGRL